MKSGMARYVIWRLGQAVFVMWAASTITFVILYILPSDPVTLSIYGGGEPSDVPPEMVNKLKEQYGLNDPLWKQYFDFLGHLLSGRLGTSIVTKVPISRSLAQAIPQTLLLGLSALVLAIVLGSAIAVASALTRHGTLRRVLLAFPPLAMSMPGFWVGLLLLQLFSFTWKLFPASGNEGLPGLVLPAVALAIPEAAMIAQVFYSSLAGTLRRPFVDTARAKGASTSRIVLRHALRPASAPVLTIIGLGVGNLIGGSVVIETVFSRAGVGRLAQQAVTAQDIPVVQAVVLVSSAAFVLASLAVDLTYPLIDRRITLPARSRSAQRRLREAFDG